MHALDRRLGRQAMHKEIAAELGVSRSYAGGLRSDPTGEKDRARKASYRGVCVECGGPTDGGNGPAHQSLRCHYCAQGKPRPVATRLTLPVRLCDLPLDVRLQGAHAANRIEKGMEERAEILLAALYPSRNVYYLAESARPILESLQQQSVAA